MGDGFRIKWIDRHREPQCAPNPAYPKGILVGTAKDTVKQCVCKLPYPAQRCGVYLVECACGARVAVTTAGRPDDPNGVIIDCRAH